jgi:hypothetical protein
VPGGRRQDHIVECPARYNRLDRAGSAHAEETCYHLLFSRSGSLFFTLATFLLTQELPSRRRGRGAQQVDGRLLCLLAVQPAVAKAGLVSLGGNCTRCPLHVPRTRS